jgi:3-oxoacyl-[acyl-carrier protein] reductase
MKHVLITGASRGIGFALVKHFLEDGHQVTAISRSPIDIGAVDYPALTLMQGDITNQAFLEKVAATVDELDVVVHNAGLLINKAFLDMTEKDLLDSYHVNAIAPYLLTKALLNKLNLHAHIVFISSVGGINGTQKFPGLSAYSPSKAAMACLAECLQVEFSEKDWSFNALALGAVQTEMLATAFPGYEAPLTAEQMAAYIYRFSLNDGQIIKGRSIVVSRSNP